MAFTCGFFNSVAHDRKYDAVQHGMIFDGIITDGIYATYLKAMVVKASENASEVIVQPGRAWFNHTWSYNDSDYPVAAPEPEVVLDRIDTLVLDVNSEDAVRNNQFLWVQGTPTSQTPEPPTLIHTATHNQYPLCDVYRQAGTTMIYAADITNRVGTSDCPFVTGVLEGIDIDDLLAQWDDEFHTWENATKASFEGWMLNQQQVYTAWFNALKTQMAGDVADVEAWVQTIKDIIDEETATHLQLEIDEINSMLPSGSHITVTTSDTELYSRTVTITDEDNNTVTSQFDANGVAVFKSVPYVGNLTITSTDGVRTATEVVSTPYFARYEFTLAFWSATVNIIGDSVLGGDTVTITDSTTALVGTVVLNASGAGVFNATYPDTYKFSVTHGGETMEVSLAVTQETTYNVEIHSGLNYQAWLNAGRVSKSFSSLDDVLEDEKTLRQLFLVHDAVDYVASQRVNNDLTKIFNTDLAAKWINNSDYALDKFYAVADIKTVMDAADKYGYGEWVNNNGTWGPKGNVPVMTANNAPYGEASASTSASADYYPWKAFSDNGQAWISANNTALPQRITYRFTNPVCVKKFLLQNRIDTDASSCTAVKDFKIQASNDNVTWVDLGTYTNPSGDIGAVYTDGVNNDEYYLYIQLWATSQYTGNYVRVAIERLQFYGRELKVSVPTMTSNTSPFGEVFSRSDSSGYQAYKAFDGNSSTAWADAQEGASAIGGYVGYKFTSPVNVKIVYCNIIGQGYKIQYSDNGINYTDTAMAKQNPTSAWYEDLLVANVDYGAHKYWRLITTSAPNSSNNVKTLQFYGLDYSEKEFEVGTTKKWLYDHGVELETMSNYSTSGSWAGAYIEKKSASIKIFTGNAAYGGGAVSAPSLDLTNYNLARAKCVEASNVASNNYIAIGVSDTAEDINWDAYKYVNSDIPNNCSFDISSFNSAEYVAFFVSKIGTGINTAEISELWLE